MVNFLSEGRENFNRRYWTLICILAMGVFMVYGLFFGQSVPLYALALAFSAVAILLYPEIGLYSIVVLTMWFERYFTLEPLQIGNVIYKIYPIDFIIGLILLSIGLRIVFEKKIKLPLKKFDWLIIIFGLLSTFAFAYGILLHNDKTLAFGTYKNYALYAIIYFLCLYLLPTKNNWKSMMSWLSIGGLGLFFFLAYGIISGQGLWSEYTPLSTLGTRLIAGTHVFYLVIFSFWVLANYLWPSAKIVNKQTWQKILFTILLLCFLGILVSLVRHLWLALAIMLIVWIFYLTKEKRKDLYKILQKGSLLTIFALILFFWISNLLNLEIINTQKIVAIIEQRVSVENIVSMEDSSARWRVSAWTAGFEAWRTQPIFGSGLGYSIVGYDGIQFFQIAMREMHNNYLGILFQMGLISFAFVVYWFVYILKKLYALAQAARRHMSENNFLQRMFFTWGSMTILFMIIFSTSVYWDVNFFVIWWWISLAGLRFILEETRQKI